jgi:hypothetical protein
MTERSAKWMASVKANFEYLLKTKALTHLRVRRHGVLLVLESGPDDDPIPHARFRRLGAHLWRLEMATHNEGWETTPLCGQIDKLLDFLLAQVPWALTPIE